MSSPVKILVVGCGHMGKSHAKAYHAMDGFEIVGVVSRGEKSRQALLAELGEGVEYPQFSNFDEALAATSPDAVSINTYPDTHAEFTKKSFAAGCHVFLEKPIAETVAEAQEIVDAARRRIANWSSAISFACTRPGSASLKLRRGSASRW